jgi:hypothetical protein
MMQRKVEKGKTVNVLNAADLARFAAEEARDQRERQGTTSQLRIYGNADSKISSYLKAWISQPDWDGKVSTCVVGLIGQGTSRALQSNWNSPFEQSNVGGMFEMAGGIAQATTGRTSITTLSSTQVWDGNRPSQFNLVLSFYALRDARAEVMAPLKELEKMLGPDIQPGASDDAKGFEYAWQMVKSSIPGGRIPQPVVINIGRRMLIPNCVIENISIPLDKERDRFGNLIRAEVNLSIATKVMLTRDDIDATWR